MDVHRKGLALRLAISLLALAAACTLTLALAYRAHAVDPLPGVQADYRWSPGVAVIGQPVTFESTSQATGLGNKIEQYRWDLDGDPSNGYELPWGSPPVVTTTYALRGTVDVRLQVSDTLGKKSTIKKSVRVAGQAPLPSFGYSPPAPVAGQPVLFTSTATDPDGTVVELTWDLNGDGSFDNGAGPTALRTFDAPGVYVVGLRATDDEGAVSFYSQAISIASLPLPVSALKPAATLRLLSPFPVVRIAGRISRRGARVKLLAVDAPPGSTVSVRCRGRGCPFRSQSRAAGAAGPQANASKRVRLRRLERLLRAGTTVRISVTRSATIGKYTVFKIRRGKAPRRSDGCLMPGSESPVPCPAA